MDSQGAPEIIVWDRSQISWRSGMWNGLYFSKAPQTSTYARLYEFQFVWNQDEVSYGVEMKSASTISRLVLNETGIIQRFLWDQSHQNWNLFWGQPIDECSKFAMCGQFGICQRDGIKVCSCLRGFEPVTPDEWSMRNTSGGCKRTRPLDIRGKGSGCVMWNTALIDIKTLAGGQDLYVKVSKSELGASSKKQLKIIVETISIAISVLLLCFVGYLFLKKKRYSKKDTTKISLPQNESIKDADLPAFDIDTILQATDNFSITNIVGQGGFGIVYKGKLPCGQEIAVKRLSGSSSQGFNEFMNEVMLVAKLQHRNLVRLLGCCMENNERALIYEFLTNKSLDFFIFADVEKRTALSWGTRLEIVTGIARGLLYLHHDSRYNIIHRDLKAANVLLDEEMNPKISDFGTARLFQRDQAVINTETVIGTRGYMSPEYLREGEFSVKSDVYSFGVLLLEIMSGKRNQGNQNLVTDAWNLWEEQSILMLLDEAVESTVFTTELLRCLHVALLCVQGCPDDRPSMSSVCMMLSSDSLVLPAPKKPFTWRSIGGFPAGHHLYEASGDQLTITGIEGR
ncbi:Serine/threonine-protein kinase [Rhynchospora pubera]|uniref:non-specific serine/threonine protein kinase n=1 Tax=Rhynchospora pubera TaxID=906938 RepID=A0AAV8FYT5_9POAL|nr:Serine/threonine-protein kinase [Rhynchospora pubera]